MRLHQLLIARLFAPLNPPHLDPLEHPHTVADPPPLRCPLYRTPRGPSGVRPNSFIPLLFAQERGFVLGSQLGWLPRNRGSG